MRKRLRHVKPHTSVGPVLVITGTAFEARLAAGDDFFVICSGGNPARLRVLLAKLDPGAFRAVISFGLAGGLDPALRPGTLITASHVICNKERWQATLTPATPAAAHHGMSLVGVDALVMDPRCKAALRADTGAAAVDMETHLAARFAIDRKLHWGALRVICDPAERGLPPLALEAISPCGAIDVAIVARRLLLAPSQLPALISVGRDTAMAVATLRRARRLLRVFGTPGHGFGRSSVHLR